MIKTNGTRRLIISFQWSYLTILASMHKLPLTGYRWSTNPDNMPNKMQQFQHSLKCKRSHWFSYLIKTILHFAIAASPPQQILLVVFALVVVCLRSVSYHTCNVSTPCTYDVIGFSFDRSVFCLLFCSVLYISAGRVYVANLSLVLSFSVCVCAERTDSITVILKFEFGFSVVIRWLTVGV